MFNDWQELPKGSAATRWVRDRRTASEDETINIGWPLLRRSGASREVAPLFVAEAETDLKRQVIRPIGATLSVSPAALKIAGFPTDEIESILSSFDELDHHTVAGLREWSRAIGFTRQRQDGTGSTTSPVLVAFVGDDNSQITYFLHEDLKRLRLIARGDLEGTALGSLLSADTEVLSTDWTAVPACVPSNAEQEQACRLALSRTLSVVTGPPGTGKV